MVSLDQECKAEKIQPVRDIFVTYLEPLSKKIFIDEDFDILKQQFEDGDKIEPFYYAPIIPMILVNGSEGIGTGYSTNIKPCNPRDIYNNIKRIFSGLKPKTMHPWYRHFTGLIEKIENNKYVSRAKYEIIDENTIHITDLPIGIWTDNYKAFLDNLSDPKIKKDAKKIEQDKISKSEKTIKNSGSKSKKNNNSKNLTKKNKKSIVAKVAKKNMIGADIKKYTENCTANHY